MNPLEILLKHIGTCSYIGCDNWPTHIMKGNVHIRAFCDAHPLMRKSYREKSFKEIKLQDLADEIEEAVALGLENIVEEKPKKKAKIEYYKNDILLQPEPKLPEPYFDKYGRYRDEIEISYSKHDDPFYVPRYYENDYHF